MPIITFWSTINKPTGQTMSLAAIATKMAVEHTNRSIIISTKYNDDTLESCFKVSNNKNVIQRLTKTPNIEVDNGIDGLAKLAYSGRVLPDIIQNYAQTIYKNRLDVLYGYKEVTDRPSYDEYLKLKQKYKEIITNANKFYDFVFVDLDKTIKDDMVKEILRISDVIVVNLEQKINMINDFMELRKNQELLKKDNILLNIGRFDNFSKYNIKNISRYTGTKKDILTIPYNTLYFEAASENRVADLFLKLRKVNDADRNANFIKQVNEAGEKIIYKIQEIQMGV